MCYPREVHIRGRELSTGRGVRGLYRATACRHHLAVREIRRRAARSPILSRTVARFARTADHRRSIARWRRRSSRGTECARLARPSPDIVRGDGQRFAHLRAMASGRCLSRLHPRRRPRCNEAVWTTSRQSTPKTDTLTHSECRGTRRDDRYGTNVPHSRRPMSRRHDPVRPRRRSGQLVISTRTRRSSRDLEIGSILHDPGALTTFSILITWRSTLAIILRFHSGVPQLAVLT